MAEPRTNLSVHLSITAAMEDNCVCLIPGSHRVLDDDEVRERYGLQMISRSQDAIYGTPNYRGQARQGVARKMIMNPGQVFIFDERMLHATSPAVSDRARFAFALRITVPEVRVLPRAFAETLPLKQRCVLLRGTDTHNLNDLDPWAVKSRRA